MFSIEVTFSKSFPVDKEDLLVIATMLTEQLFREEDYKDLEEDFGSSNLNDLDAKQLTELVTSFSYTDLCSILRDYLVNKGELDSSDVFLIQGFNFNHPFDALIS